MNPQTIPSTDPPARRATLPLTLGAVGFLAGAGLVAHGFLNDWNGSGWIGAALMGFSPLLAARFANRRNKALRPAMRRYNERLTLNMAVYVVALFAGVELYRRGLTTGAWGYLIALLPALPIVNCFAIMARLMKEETDEVQRHIMQTALMWAGALTLGEATVWGFLETFDKVPNIWMWAVPVLFFAQLGVTMPLAAGRYR